MATSPGSSLPGMNEAWARGAEKRRSRHAKQTRQEARRKLLERERERLLRLGADPAWVDRVIGEVGDELGGILIDP